jgi:hypothetical protein
MEKIISISEGISIRATHWKAEILLGKHWVQKVPGTSGKEEMKNYYHQVRNLLYNTALAKTYLAASRVGDFSFGAVVRSFEKKEKKIEH